MSIQKNVLGTPLKPCCVELKTGFYRDGYCHTDANDSARHVVCAIMTKEFLEYTASKGNNLSIPNLLFDFPGLKPGDKVAVIGNNVPPPWFIVDDNESH